MALRYIGLAVSLKLQKSNEKYRRLGKISILLQDRLIFYLAWGLAVTHSSVFC